MSPTQLPAVPLVVRAMEPLESAATVPLPSMPFVSGQYVAVWSHEAIWAPEISATRDPLALSSEEGTAAAPFDVVLEEPEELPGLGLDLELVFLPLCGTLAVAIVSGAGGAIAPAGDSAAEDEPIRLEQPAVAAASAAVRPSRDRRDRVRRWPGRLRRGGAGTSGSFA
jgi:hypothetical protein